jgi:hypothetical protein
MSPRCPAEPLILALQSFSRARRDLSAFVAQITFLNVRRLGTRGGKEEWRGFSRAITTSQHLGFSRSGCCLAEVQIGTIKQKPPGGLKL